MKILRFDFSTRKATVMQSSLLKTAVQHKKPFFPTHLAAAVNNRVILPLYRIAPYPRKCAIVFQAAAEGYDPFYSVWASHFAVNP
jgi:hypothetical protein